MWRESFEIRSQIYFTALDIVAAGLLFCIPGDFFSSYIGKDNRFFSVSLVTLTVAQLLFLAGMSLINLLDGWVPALITAAVLVILYAVMLRRGIWKNPCRSRGLMTVCLVACALAAGKAFAGFLSDPEGTALLLSAGCFLFFLGVLLTGTRAGYLTSTLCFAASMLTALSCGPLLAG